MKYCNKFSTVLIFFILLLTNCKFNSQRVNNHYDTDAALEVTNNFYMYFHAQNYEKTYQYFGKKMLNISDTSKLKEFLINITDKYGKIVKYNMKNCESMVQSGTNPISEYHVVYENTYEKGTILEDFILEKENDTIKINGYHITTDKL